MEKDNNSGKANNGQHGRNKCDCKDLAVRIMPYLRNSNIEDGIQINGHVYIRSGVDRLPLLKDQQGKCGICKCGLLIEKDGEFYTRSDTILDHCPCCNAYRGIVCNHCNLWCLNWKVLFFLYKIIPYLLFAQHCRCNK